MNKILRSIKLHWLYYIATTMGCVCAIVGLLTGNLLLSAISVVITLIVSIIDKLRSDTIDCGTF